MLLCWVSSCLSMLTKVMGWCWDLSNAVQREGCTHAWERMCERLILTLQKSLVSLSCPQSSLFCRMPS